MGVFIKSKSATADHRLNQFGTAVLVWCAKALRTLRSTESVELLPN